MTSDNTELAATFSELIDRYEIWRRAYFYAGKSIRDEPIWQGRRLNFRYGYPHEGWTAYIIEPKTSGFEVLSATTERSNNPREGVVAYFSHLEDAGKYIIWYVGESLRMHCWLPPLTPSWRAAGLDPRVKQTSLDTYVSKYELLDDPSRYFILQAGGVQPENRLLPLTYDELDAALLEGMPESVTSRL